MERIHFPCHRFLLTFLFTTFLCVAIWYSLMIPAGEGVDETAHLDYTLFIASHHRLPVADLVQPPGDALMAHHPPLYYLLGAILVAPIDTTDRSSVLVHNPHFVWDTDGRGGWNVVLPDGRDQFPWSGTLLALHLLRLFGVLCGTLTIGLVYFTLKEIFPTYPWAPLGGSAVIAFNPSFIFMSSTVHHDVLLTAIAAAIVFWCVLHIERRVTNVSVAIIGALLAAAALSKLSGLLFAPLVVIVLSMRQRHDSDWQNRWWQLLAIATIMTLAGGWWYLRNQFLYGDPIGYNVYRALFAFNLRRGPFTWGLFVEEFVPQMARTFWGAFGFMHILLPEYIRFIVWCIALIAVAGWIPVSLRRVGRKIPVTRKEALVWAVLLGEIVLVFLFLVRFAATTRGAGHGRYMFVVVPSIAALLIGGINGYANWRKHRAISVFMAGGFLIYSIWAPTQFVWDKYKINSNVPEVQLRNAAPVNLHFPGGVHLRAVDVSAEFVIPGSAVDVTTYWYAPQTADPSIDPFIYLSLVGSTGSLIGAASFYPELATTPAVWGERTIVFKQPFYIPPDTPAGEVKVFMTVTNGPDGEPLVPFDELVISAPIAKLLVLGSLVEVTPEQIPQPLRHELLGSSIRLVGATLPVETEAGSVLSVHLYWQVLQNIPRDYTVFVHVVDVDGNVVAQIDRPPGGGTLPTSQWLVGFLVRDVYPVPIPPTLPDKTYSVLIGLYAWPELKRLPVSVHGQETGDYVVIGETRITSTGGPK